MFKKEKAEYIFHQLHDNLAKNIVQEIKKSVDIVFYDEQAYPERLLALFDFPFVLFYRGRLEMLTTKYPLAIIGSRHPSDYSMKVLHHLFKQFIKYQPTIISGLAYGVDSLAHRLAIRYHIRTVGVLAFGHHYIYPKINKDLFSYMAQNECLISEYPPEQPIFKSQFVARNRLIAALSDKILITEAEQKSGTQLTIDFGLDLGKDICCIPGDIMSNLSKAPNYYIKEGAILITDAEDIFEL